VEGRELRIYVTVLTLLCALQSFANSSYEDIPIKCPSTKEFITVLNYLRERSHHGFSEAEIRDTAFKVSQGCAGSAARFTRTFETLLKTEAAARGSMELAVQLSPMTDAYTDTFLEVFKKSYLAEFLDLDYLTSLQMARSLSIEYLGDPLIAEKDFLALVEFCTSEKWMGLSKPRCGVIAGRIVKSAEKFNREVAPQFKNTFEFIVSDRGPTPDLMKALELSERIVAMGPDATENFIQAYRFGIDKDGLALAAKDSLHFALRLGRFSEWKEDSDRYPASQKVQEKPAPKVKD
jgi:hypothetical protein